MVYRGAMDFLKFLNPRDSQEIPEIHERWILTRFLVSYESCSNRERARVVYIRITVRSTNHHSRERNLLIPTKAFRARKSSPSAPSPGPGGGGGERGRTITGG